MDLKSSLETFAREAFRLELLNNYDIPETRPRLQAFLRGDPLPPTLHNEWLSRMRNAVAAGKAMRRVHIVPAKLTPYLRYEIEWGYLYSAEAGEDINLLTADEAPTDLLAAARQDFWLFDDRVAIMMEYDEGGRFTGSREVSDEPEVRRLVALKHDLLRYATPLRQYLAQQRNRTDESSR